MKSIVKICAIIVVGVSGFMLGTLIETAYAALQNNQPSWFEHVDLMQLIIIGLIVIVSGFIKKDLSRFEKTLTEACAELGKKADKEEVERKADGSENKEDHESLWKRINHHKHTEFGEVVIIEK